MKDNHCGHVTTIAVQDLPGRVPIRTGHGASKDSYVVRAVEGQPSPPKAGE